MKLMYSPCMDQERETRPWSPSNTAAWSPVHSGDSVDLTHRDNAHCTFEGKFFFTVYIDVQVRITNAYDNVKIRLKLFQLEQSV